MLAFPYQIDVLKTRVRANPSLKPTDDPDGERMKT